LDAATFVLKKDSRFGCPEHFELAEHLRVRPRVPKVMDNVTIFIAVTAVAVVLQMLILLGMLIAVLKMKAKMEALAAKVEDTTSTVQSKVLPLLDEAKILQQNVKSFIETARPKIDVVLDNAAQITTAAKGSTQRVETTVNDVVDRIRLQVIRGDEMLTRTMDRVEETSEKVQHTVMSPVRQVSGIVQAIGVGVGSFFNQQRRRRNGGPSDEMFI
jgi:methyl-accepting chemotaxis protein